LKDKKKRAEYDKYGAASQQQGFDADAYERARNAFGGGGFNPFGAPFGGSGFSRRGPASQEDLFEALFGSFGGTGRGPTVMRGEDITASVSVTFLEACKGASKNVTIHPVATCGTCSGSGLKSGASRTTCMTCRGTGAQVFSQGGFQMSVTCTTCGGAGSTVPKGSHCGTCGGVGTVRTKKNIKVDIPAGSLLQCHLCTLFILFFS
jgi:molecular chaperone DnaJ